MHSIGKLNHKWWYKWLQTSFLFVAQLATKGCVTRKSAALLLVQRCKYYWKVFSILWQYSLKYNQHWDILDSARNGFVWRFVGKCVELRFVGKKIDIRKSGILKYLHHTFLSHVFGQESGMNFTTDHTALRRV